MAAAVRFVFQPGAPLGESLGFAERADEGRAYRQIALPLREILSNRSAISFLFFWFLANFLFGTIPVPLVASPMRQSPGRPIWAAFSSGFWHFAGSTRPRRPSTSRASCRVSIGY